MNFEFPLSRFHLIFIIIQILYFTLSRNLSLNYTNNYYLNTQNRTLDHVFEIREKYAFQAVLSRFEQVT